MKASKHEDDNLFKDLDMQYQKETITENITLLDYFLDLINKSLKHTKSILLTCIYMAADFPVFVRCVSITCCEVILISWTKASPLSEMFI
jgi:hypothetical protein